MLNNVQRLKRCLLVFVLNLPYRRIPLMEFLDVVQFHRLFLNCHWHSSTEVFICVSPSRVPVLSFARYFQAPATQANSRARGHQTQLGAKIETAFAQLTVS